MKKVRGKTFATEIFFALDSKEIFQDKQLKIIHFKKNEEKVDCLCIDFWERVGNLTMGKLS